MRTPLWSLSLKSKTGRCTANRSGFTLVELLVVLAIITLLMTIGLSSYNELMKRSRDTRRESDLKRIQAALQQYYADRGIYPTAITFGTELNINTGRGGKAVVSPARVYLSQVPSEPLAASALPYCYEAQPANCINSGGTDCTSYKLFAKLENPPSSTTYTCNSITTYNYTVTSP